MRPSMLIAFLSVCIAPVVMGADTVIDPGRFGAKPDGQTLCTEAIQKTIDDSAVAGGAFLSGTIHLHNALIRGCQPRAPKGTFIKFSGDRTHNVAVIENDLRGAGTPVETAPDVPRDVLSIK